MAHDMVSEFPTSWYFSEFPDHAAESSLELGQSFKNPQQLVTSDIFSWILSEISQKKHTPNIVLFLLENNEILGERPNLKVQLEKISIIYFLEDFTVPF